MCPPAQPSPAQEYRVWHLHLRVDVAQHIVQAHNVVNDIIKLEERKVHLGMTYLKSGSHPPTPTPPHPTCCLEEEMNQRKGLRLSLRLV